MTTPTRDSRWLALVVLCAGMLMVILDQTIVNVALPTIQEDLGFSAAGLAWVVNAYLIAFGGLLLLAGRLGDLIGRRAIFLAGLAVFTFASLLVRALRQPGDADRGALRPGRRRRAELRRDPRHDRDDVPQAGRAGEGDRHLQLRRLRGRLDRPAGRRRADPGARLALDLLRQRADRRSPRWSSRARLLEPEAGLGLQRRRRRPRRGARDRRADARRLHDRRRALVAARRAGRRRCSARSSGARRPPRSRCCASASCAPATSRARTSRRC